MRILSMKRVGGGTVRARLSPLYCKSLFITFSSGKVGKLESEL